MPGEVVRYDRVQPVFRSTQIEKETGDALLSALEGGRQIGNRTSPPDVVCALPIPPQHVLAITRTNGTRYQIGVSFDGGSIYLPEGLYVVSDPARKKAADVIRQLDQDLRREIVNAPKPLTYRVGTIDDKGTLSGIARVFYGDASKWRKIYEANRKVIKNPDVIDGRLTLTIPKLE
jgi:hypothetical protein